MARHLLPALALLLPLALLPGPAPTREPDPARAEPNFPVGTYKFVLPLRGEEPLWLVKFAVKDGKPYGAVIATRPPSGPREKALPKATLENLRVSEDGLIRFKLAFEDGGLDIEARVPRDKNGKILGSLAIRDSISPIVLEPTKLVSLDAYELNKEVIATATNPPDVIRAAMLLLGKAGENKAKPEDVKAWADKALASAEPFGPRWHRDVLFDIAEALTEQEGLGEVALAYARQAEKLLTDKDPPGLRKKTLNLLAAALEKSGKAEEAKAAKARAEAIPPVTPTPFAGRKGNSKRVVLVELFTGAQCPPCVAADLAFDGLQKSYKPSEVVLLQYHLHIPRPDALTNPDTEARAAFYGDDVEGTPTLFLNGTVGPAGGGRTDDAQARYDEFTAALNPLLEKGPRAGLKAKAALKDGKVAVDVEADVEEPGEHIKLRIALVEEEVAYKGTNGIEKHHCVVRAFPGGAEGSAVKEKSLKKSETVDLEELRKTLTAYLDKTSEKRPFPTKDRPLELKKLRVVAFVQNDRTKEVLQAVQVEVE
jgi:thiol-disulfide isomerase/thioredoxin